MLKISMKPLVLKFWWRHVVVFTEVTKIRIVGVDTGDVGEASLAVNVEGLSL